MNTITEVSSMEYRILFALWKWYNEFEDGTETSRTISASKLMERVSVSSPKEIIAFANNIEELERQGYIQQQKFQIFSPVPIKQIERYNNLSSGDKIYITQLREFKDASSPENQAYIIGLIELTLQGIKLCKGKFSS